VTEKHVVVVGSGAAGTAAALAARAANARVTMIRGKVGATALGSGAIDSHDVLDDDTQSIARALELFSFERATLATNAGTLRTARGRDLALADLGATKGAVLVARVAHPSWDADALAASYAELDARGFVARDVGLVVHPRERAMRHAELAAAHDDPTRLALAAERIREALATGGAFGAVLLPPWLGASAPRAKEISALVGLPCGEILVAEGGPAGTRFENARDRSLQHASIESRAGRVKRVASDASTCTVVLEDDTSLDADAVILATGGVLAGGISYTPGDAASAGAVPPPSRAPFALAYDAPVVLGVRGRAFVVPGSVFGVAPESLTWPRENPSTLERVGIRVDARLRATECIFVCGDALEDRPRTIASALSTGVVAGRAAASS
jgi:glycerol-3-phosphate dehydrogenase subunit B